MLLLCRPFVLSSSVPVSDHFLCRRRRATTSVPSPSSLAVNSVDFLAVRLPLPRRRACRRLPLLSGSFLRRLAVAAVSKTQRCRRRSPPSPSPLSNPCRRFLLSLPHRRPPHLSLISCAVAPALPPPFSLSPSLSFSPSAHRFCCRDPDAVEVDHRRPGFLRRRPRRLLPLSSATTDDCRLYCRAPPPPPPSSQTSR